ncbi:MAG: beta-lactamase family protein [Gammaproteobacteria bacterium]|nr:beta-lactamase family protein [Gammaproteobacteria bacterium]
MKKRTLAIAATASLILQAGPLFALSPEQQVAESFGEFFRAQVVLEDITGAAFVVATPEGIVHVGTSGHTDTSESRAIDEHTTFRVASVSKTFAAGLAGVLVEEGEFDWDDRLVDYVPDFRLKGDESRVRIRHVLGQSTGVVPHAYDNLIEDGVPLERIRDQFSKLPYLCAPGSCYSYQNSIFSLIEPVMEKTTSRSYADLMEEKIFRPLDMRTASVGYEPFVGNPNHARPHVKTRSGWKTVNVKPNYYRVAPAAGVNASATDMGKWLAAQMGGRPAVLHPEVVDTLTTPRVRTPRDKRRKHWRDLLSDAHYGLGWRIYRLGEHEIAYHSGWVSGYRADIAWSETHGIGIAVLMNVEGNGINKLTTTFWRMAFDALPAEMASRPAGVSPIAAASH